MIEYYSVNPWGVMYIGWTRERVDWKERSYKLKNSWWVSTVGGPRFHTGALNIWKHDGKLGKSFDTERSWVITLEAGRPVASGKIPLSDQMIMELMYARMAVLISKHPRPLISKHPRPNAETHQRTVRL